MSPAEPNDNTQRKRKSVQELVNAFERSSEKLADQFNSSVITLAEAGSDVFVAGVRLLSDIVEFGAERVQSVGCAAAGKSSAAASTPAARIMNAQRETLATAIRIHSQAIKQATDIAQASVDRISKGTVPSEPA